MAINTLKELIDWTRDLHGKMAHSLADAAERHQDEMARGLLEYLAGHEADLERMVNEFEHQGNQLELETRDYDYLSHYHQAASSVSQQDYAALSSERISEEIFAFHNQILSLYQALARRVVLPEMSELLQQLLEMEEGETRRMAAQIGRMESL